MQSLPCKAISGQPAVAAPLWAQQAGAGSQTSGWWCQLPHATKLPANFVAISRTVDPLPNTYADFTTEYGTGGLHQFDGGGTEHHRRTRRGQRGDRPDPPPVPAAAAGTTVTLAHGVQATMISKKHLVSVRWRYPTSGVPKYLRGVATVTVIGSGVPASTVLAVARAVEPD